MLCHPVTGLPENSESGVNPERYRHCMHGDLCRTKVSHWASPEKTAEWFGMCKSGDLLVYYAFAFRCKKAKVDFVCRKTAAAVSRDCRSFFGIERPSPPLAAIHKHAVDCPWQHAVRGASRCSGGAAVLFRAESICLERWLQQKSSGHHPVSGTFSYSSGIPAASQAITVS